MNADDAYTDGNCYIHCNEQRKTNSCHNIHAVITQVEATGEGYGIITALRGVCAKNKNHVTIFMSHVDPFAL